MGVTRALVRAAAVVTAAVVASWGGLTSAQAGGARQQPVAVTVMTQNVYLGGDITRPITAAAGLQGPAALVALGNASHELRSVVDRTDFGVRSRLLARGIAGARPDLVGLQEVALWRHGPLQLQPDQLGRLNAEQVDEDFLATLLADLRRQGLRYDVASVQTETDVEAPAFRGSPFDQTITEARDVRLTMHDVILVRQHSGLQVTDRGGAQYQARINVDLGGLGLSIVRGYTWVDVRSRQGGLRLVNTHLESQSSDVALAQAEELLTGPARDRRRTVLVCDCNSDRDTAQPPPGSTVAYNAAYRAIADAGFTDQWRAARPSPGTGNTAALSELVNDPTAAGLNRRIDLVFARSAAHPAARRATVVGDEPADRDRATGLWPADHAGVSILLRLR